MDCVAVPDYFLDSHLVRAASLLSKPLPMEQFQVIQGFISRVPQGKKMVEEVDRAIGACAELHDLKEELLKNQRKLEGFRPERLEQVRPGEAKGLFLGPLFLSLMVSLSVQWFLEGVGVGVVGQLEQWGRTRKREVYFF